MYISFFLTGKCKLAKRPWKFLQRNTHFQQPASSCGNLQTMYADEHILYPNGIYYGNYKTMHPNVQMWDCSSFYENLMTMHPNAHNVVRFWHLGIPKPCILTYTFWGVLASVIGIPQQCILMHIFWGFWQLLWESYNHVSSCKH